MVFSNCGTNGNIYEQYNQNKPAYNGGPVRIMPFWTQEIVSDQFDYRFSFAQINTAARILTQHTLGLDFGSLNGYNFVLPLNTHIFFGSNNEMEVLTNLRKFVDESAKTASFVPEENRLIVVFAHIDNPDIAGRCVLTPDWLPWVVVDPLNGSNITLVHEIGHACRCQHVAGSIMQACDPYSSGYTSFYNIHAYEIFRSYWCSGPRPQNWWAGMTVDLNSPNRGPYLWPPYDQPSP